MMTRIIVVIGLALALAACGSSTAAKAPSHKAVTAPPGVARYADATSLVTALAGHGDTCSGVSYTGTAMATCQGVPTTVLTFSSSKATHANLVKVGQDMLALASATGKTVAVVIGPNWIVVGTPAFASKVQHDLGGQYIGP
jgi:ABC-type taurine transport system substrate-binding protein